MARAAYESHMRLVGLHTLGMVETDTKSGEPGTNVVQLG